MQPARGSLIERLTFVGLLVVSGALLVRYVVAGPSFLWTASAILVGLLFAQRGMLRLWRAMFSTPPVRLRPEPVPEHWAEMVRSSIPVTQQLPAADFEHLLKLVQAFLHEKNIEGAGGLEITEEIRLTIAAQACLLLLKLDVGLYPALETVIVYPSAVVPKYAGQRWQGGELHQDAPQPILGQSWTSGVVVLSWDSAAHGAYDPRDGQNVVLHEFAHQLDQETGEADGIPVGIRLSALKPWAEMLERRFRELVAARRRGRDSVMDHYGAKNEAEFFAVATETFFEKPRQLRAKIPDLYDLLVEFYGVDPGEGFRPRADASAGDRAT
jgi:Mlc titration factor MtfA (ptsG expression regulator)